jgi:hypothetical protein
MQSAIDPPARKSIALIFKPHITIMNFERGQQLSLITELEIDDPIVGDWGWEKLGTEDLLVPNSPASMLGTNKSSVPNLEEWKPPVGGLEKKSIKDRQYWYWRYYDKRSKKASRYLGKDYNRAVLKAMQIGVPPDAKLPNLSPSDPQAQNPTARALITIPPTAHNTSGPTAA